jgi:hypothetical protein
VLKLLVEPAVRFELLELPKLLVLVVLSKLFVEPVVKSELLLRPPVELVVRFELIGLKRLEVLLVGILMLLPCFANIYGCCLSASKLKADQNQRDAEVRDAVRSGCSPVPLDMLAALQLTALQLRSVR